MLSFFTVVLVASLAAAFGDLPMLNMDGFSWAENLHFDGLGGLFVSEAVLGQLFRISYDIETNSYVRTTHISKGFNQFGGLAVTENGELLYAAAVFDDKSFGIIATSTKPSAHGDQIFSVVARGLEHLCNGMVLVPVQNALYGTSETGTLTRIDISSGNSSVVTADLAKPDGLWFDAPSSLLFIGELVTKKMRVFDVLANEFLLEDFAAASSLGTVHMIDDLQVVGAVDRDDVGATRIVAADFTGKQVAVFRLDGQDLRIASAPEGITLFEPTSVRRGRGPGFDADAYYVTEGGGATRHMTQRRVLQFTAGSIE
eukprot:gene25433-30710_t